MNYHFSRDEISLVHFLPYHKITLHFTRLTRKDDETEEIRIIFDVNQVLIKFCC